MAVYTIGHSNGPFDAFAALLKMHGIREVADIRSVPMSRFAPQYNYDALEMALTREGIAYEYMGDRLGGRPRSSAFTKHDGSPDYEKMAKDEAFIDGLEMVVRMAERTVLCLMCSEEDPTKCHRAKLVAEQLALRGVEVLHILENGEIETEARNARRRVTPSDLQIEISF